VSFSPDRVMYGSPIELKTNRTPVEPTPEKLLENFHHYFEQLLIYMVLMSSRHGELWVLFINLRDISKRTFPEPRCYTVSISDEQHQISMPRLFRRVIDSRSQSNARPFILAPCRNGSCGDGTCSWWANCKPEADLEGHVVIG